MKIERRFSIFFFYHLNSIVFSNHQYETAKLFIKKLLSSFVLGVRNKPIMHQKVDFVSDHFHAVTNVSLRFNFEMKQVKICLD